MWQYYTDYPNDTITQSESLKYKIKRTEKPPVANNTNDLEIVMPIKCLSNFWRILEKLLINWEVNLISTWSEHCVIPYTVGKRKLKICRYKT